jgi:hypothetical protein
MKLLKKLFYIYLLFVASLTSCTSLNEGPFVDRKGVNSSVEGIIKAFDKGGIGIRGQSANGREIVTKYHSPKGDGYDNAATKTTRAYSRLRILGDRRPYTLQVQYVVEKRKDSGEYVVQSYDEEKAQKILKKLLDFLVTRPDREDFIDDFRPF